MSTFKYLFGGELFRAIGLSDLERRMDAQESRARRARIRARQGSDDRVEALEDAVGQLGLFVQTLYRLAIEKGTLTPAEFAEAAKAIDRSDGREDGRYTSERGP